MKLITSETAACFWLTEDLHEFWAKVFCSSVVIVTIISYGTVVSARYGEFKRKTKSSPS